MNVKDSKWEPRADLFSSEAEVADAVTIALEPLLKSNALPRE
jgi:hypothetical protein